MQHEICRHLSGACEEPVLLVEPGLIPQAPIGLVEHETAAARITAPEHLRCAGSLVERCASWSSSHSCASPSDSRAVRPTPVPAAPPAIPALGTLQRAAQCRLEQLHYPRKTSERARDKQPIVIGLHPGKAIRPSASGAKMCRTPLGFKELRFPNTTRKLLRIQCPFLRRRQIKRRRTE